MSDTITATLVENTETITATLYDGGDEIIAHINELARGPAGADGSGGGGGGSGSSAGCNGASPAYCSSLNIAVTGKSRGAINVQIICCAVL